MRISIKIHLELFVLLFLLKLCAYPINGMAKSAKLKANRWGGRKRGQKDLFGIRISKMMFG